MNGLPRTVKPRRIKPETGKSVFSLVNLICLSACFSISLSIAAEPNVATPSSVSLYLPVESSKYASLFAFLQSGLSAHGIHGVKLQGSDFWHGYQQNLRAGQVGIYLAAPHYAAWTIQKYNFTPLLRIAQPLSYVIAALKKNASIFEMSDLADKNICTQTPLNLDYILATRAFENPLLSAKIEVVDSVAAHMRNPNTPCHAFSISTHTFEQFSNSNPHKFIRLQQSIDYNNYAVIAHPNIPAELNLAIQEYIQLPETQQLLLPILELFAAKPSLTASKRADYPPSYLTDLSIFWD